MRAWISSSSSRSFWVSSATKRLNCMSSTALAWIWESSKASINPSRASSVVGALRISSTTSSMLSSAIRNPLEYVFAGPGAFQLEARPTLDDLDPVVDEVREHLAHAQRLGLAGDQTDCVHAEGRLQGGVFEQLVGDAARE